MNYTLHYRECCGLFIFSSQCKKKEGHCLWLCEVNKYWDDHKHIDKSNAFTA